MKTKFYICKHCGNLVGMIHNSNVPMMCCGEKMQALEANTVDASLEKHLPQVELKDGVLTVTVGSVIHPMIPEHFIQWIFVETDKGGHRRVLKADEEPKATFILGEEKAVAVYAYCNLHGLWKTDL